MDVIRKYSGSNSGAGTGTPVLDENDFTTNSDTSAASQKSTDFRIDSKTSKTYRQHFKGDIPNTPTTTKSWGVEVINPVQTGDPLNVSGLLSRASVTAGDGFIYMLTTNGQNLLKFDPQTDKITESLLTGNTLGGEFNRGFYNKKEHKIYFRNKSFDIIVFDIFSKKFSLLNSGFGVADIEPSWTNRDQTYFYGISLINSNVVYKFDIENETFSSFNDLNLVSSSIRLNTFCGLGKNNIAYILSSRYSSSSASPILLKFNCNTEQFEADNLTLSQNGVFIHNVIDANSRFLYTISVDTRFPSGIIKIDLDSFTEVNYISRATIGYGTGFPTNFFGGFTGLDGSIIFFPSILQGDDFVSIQDDGSDITDTFTAGTVGITSRKGFQGKAYGLNGAVYTALIDNGMYKFTFANRKYNPTDLITSNLSLTN